MRRLLRILAVCFMCGVISAPQYDAVAQGRRPGANERRENRGNNGGHKQGNGDRHNNRPGHGHGNHGGNDNHNNRPNHGGNNNNRPNHGGNGNNYNRPNHGGNHNKPNHGGHYNRPDRPSHHPVHRPPVRPHRPNHFRHHRPTPPQSFRPHYHLTPLQAILGIAFGTAFDASLNYLYANNYAVDGYVGNQLYLRNVSAMSYMWPDVTLYYTNGVLTSSNFCCSTSYFDSSRYNSLYTVLSNSYGAPMSRVTANNGWSCTWWGYDNRYITLDYHPNYAADGSLRYYTTLIIG